MIDLVLSFLASNGVIVVALSAFLSCMLLPIPTSLIMLTAGGFCAAGELDLATVWIATWAAAVLGDQTGYWIGRRGSAWAVPRLTRKPARAKMWDKARAFVDKHGTIGVFLSTWLFAPLGPWVNFAAGGAGLSWIRFTLADVAGEAIWVSVYIALGYVFADQIDTVFMVLSNSSGFLVAGLVTYVLGYIMVRRIRSRLQHV